MSSAAPVLVPTFERLLAGRVPCDGCHAPRIPANLTRLEDGTRRCPECLHAAAAAALAHMTWRAD